MTGALSRCDLALELLGEARSSLASSIEERLGHRPSLQVLSASRCPAPGWAVPPLSDGSDVLLRWTAYRLGSMDLSRHVAAVDVSRLDPLVLAALEGGTVSLAEVLEEPGTEKVALRVGIFGQDNLIEEDLLRSFAASGTPRASAYRRYEFTRLGVPAGLVIEALPCALWKNLAGMGNSAGAGSRP